MNITDRQSLFESYMRVTEETGLGPNVNPRGNIIAPPVGSSGNVGNSNIDIAKSNLTASSEDEELEFEQNDDTDIKKDLYQTAKLAVEIFDIVQNGTEISEDIKHKIKSKNYIDEKNKQNYWFNLDRKLENLETIFKKHFDEYSIDIIGSCVIFRLFIHKIPLDVNKHKLTLENVGDKYIELN
jgi:ABC-type antimicrobial peptide transport system permease subunit